MPPLRQPPIREAVANCLKLGIHLSSRLHGPRQLPVFTAYCQVLQARALCQLRHSRGAWKHLEYQDIRPENRAFSPHPSLRIILAWSMCYMKPGIPHISNDDYALQKD